MSFFKDNFPNFIDKYWTVISFGSNITAFLVNIITENFWIALSFVCTALAPAIYRGIKALSERRLDEEKLRHEEAMNRIREQEAAFKLNLLEKQLQDNTESLPPAE
jgi:hypothetical protein